MYMKSFGFICTVCIIASFIGQVGFDLFSNIWLSLWSGDMSAVGPNATVDTDLANLRVGVYGAIGGAQGKYPKKVSAMITKMLYKNGKIYKENSTETPVITKIR